MVRKINQKLVFIDNSDDNMRELYSNNGWNGGCMTLNGQYFYRD